VIEQNISMLMAEPDRTEHDHYLHRYMTTKQAHVVGIEREVVGLHKNGEPRYLSLSVNEMTSGNEHFFVGIVGDISERKRNEEAITKLAHFDANTGLPNRTLFFDRFQCAIAQARRSGQQLAVMFLDLDGFKAVNDTLGHVAGDALLTEVAARLLKSIRAVDTVARFGGDEFAFVLNNATSEANIALVANRVITSLAEPFMLDGVSCQIGGSLGIAMFPQDHESMDTLINQADTAMYVAKKGGKNHYRFFTADMSAA